MVMAVMLFVGFWGLKLSTEKFVTHTHTHTLCQYSFSLILLLIITPTHFTIKDIGLSTYSSKQVHNFWHWLCLSI